MTTEAEFFDVDVEDVRALTIGDPRGERRLVLLAVLEGELVLAVRVSGFEGDAIVIGLLRAEARRPLTHAFAAQLLHAVGVRLQEVRIDRVVDETFYAQAVLESSGGTSVIDARPATRSPLALETGAPYASVRRSCSRPVGLGAELVEERGIAVNTRSAPGQPRRRNSRTADAAAGNLGGSRRCFERDRASMAAT